MNVKFLIDPNDFKGTAVSVVDSEGMVAYSGYLYNNGGKDLTVEEFKRQTNNANLIVIDFETLMTEYLNPYHKSLQTEWEEISEEKYDYYLNVLPPVRWTGGYPEFFFMCEPLTADLHSCIIKADGKYYAATRSIRLKTEEIRADYIRFKHSREIN